MKFPVTIGKDLIKNTPLVTGASGLKGAAPLMVKTKPLGNLNQKQMSPNKYLAKIAEVSEENKQVAKTFATQTVANIPAHILGGAVGGKLGGSYLNNTGSSISHGINKATLGARKLLRSTGSTGTRIASGLKIGKISGSALGVGLGMAAAGGIADIAALKYGLHGKIKND